MTMKKRLTALALCLLLLSSVFPAALAADGPTELATVEDLLKLGTDPDGSYILTRDIDMSGVTWVPPAFSGKLDGNGHTIYNLSVYTVGMTHRDTVDGNNKKYDSEFAGFFSVLDGAEVKNLQLRGVDINVTSAGHCFVGALAGYAKNSLIQNCALRDARLTLVAACTMNAANSSKPRPSSNAGVGGLVGFGTAIFHGCSVDVTLVFDDACDDGVWCEEFMGGILSCGNGDIYNCSVNIDGYDACRGYAHNGGLMGMYYQYDKSEELGKITGCAVNGIITFFEDNKDRRAYCESFVGELLTYTNMSECSQTFLRNELFDYDVKLNPETCDNPVFTKVVHEADCTTWGYTTHTCTVCGNTWDDSFVPPTHQPGDWVISQPATYETAGERQRICTVCGQVVERQVIAPHVAGEWVLVREPDFGVEGLRQLLCADCGEVLEEEVIPAKVAASEVTLTPSRLLIHYKETAQLSARVLPVNVDVSLVYFESSDPSVATVDTDGTVHAVGRGSAVITCRSADGQATATCPVLVSYSVRQWLIEILLFGWIWY
ncbi:MAG: Ig-like domain-containing protein [Oscillospiraceae bacterium]|nr:Ig-like domain-containing protein [Oscillospiraceae bacterium]